MISTIHFFFIWSSFFTADREMHTEFFLFLMESNLLFIYNNVNPTKEEEN